MAKEESPKKKAKKAAAEDTDVSPSPVKNILVVMVACLPFVVAAFMGWKILRPSGPPKETRERNACLTKKEGIDHYKRAFLNAGEVKKDEELPDYLTKILRQEDLLECPSAGTINIGVIGANVSCSIHGEFARFVIME